MIWMPSRDGKISVKSAYKHLTLSDRDIEINGRVIQASVWKSLWHCSASHRIKVFTWKCIHGIHSTKAKLSIYNDSSDTQCGFCGNHYETIEHLLLECSFSKTVWRHLNINIEEEQNKFGSVSEWAEDWFSSNLNSSNEKRLLSLMIGSWVLWKDRCDAIFQGVALNPLNTVHRINFYLNSHMNTSSMHISDSMHNTSSSLLAVSRWKPPRQDTLKFNTDASFSHDTNQLGTGMVLRNFPGICQGIQGHYSDGVLSPDSGECMAIREALIWAKDLKDDNQVADAVAKSVRETTSNIYHLNEFPADICEL
ncbi:uncharacterized protein LOC113296312 [Papaver somniferum]|uniref:uncharacterized protein LOC113296312 n=1 Tax=Papaver somniferum TaxID=3469 RepID=UPI000E70271D|nr:uncharacterized protein LOC113296312 [Papaver somniferum]